MRLTLLQEIRVAFLFCAVLGGACGLITDQDRIKIAQIGDGAITRGDLKSFLQELPIEQRYKARSKEAKLQVLDQMIVKRLLLKEADRRGLQATEDEIQNEMMRRGVMNMGKEAREDYGIDEQAQRDYQRGEYEQIKTELRTAKLIQQIVPPGLTVSDDEVKQFYEQNKERLFTLPERVRFRYITCPTKEEAQKILERVRAGEKFSEIVNKRAAETQGKAAQELPPSAFVPLDRIVPEQLRDAMKKAKPNEIVGPVQRQDGFDVVQLIEHQKAGVVPFDQIKDPLKQNLLMAKFSQTYTAFLDQLKQQYQVKVFAEKLPEDMPF